MQQNNINLKNQEYTDLTILLKQIWKKKIIVILTAALFTIVSIIVSTVVLTPMYKSMTKIYIVSQGDSAEITTQDLQLGDLLIQDYQEIILSNSVLELVAKEVHLPINEIQSKVKVTAPRDNRILTITAVDDKPEKAAEIANETREKSIDKIKEITKVKDITVIEEAKVAKSPYSPNLKKNAALGFAIGFILSIIIIITKEILDDRVRYPEDVENYIGTTLIGVIPKTDMKRK